MKNYKLYLNKETNEINVKYVCCDCGVEMDEAKNYVMNCVGNVADPFSAIFRCDKCYKKYIQLTKGKDVNVQ